MMNNMKEQKGITLIALVITIIVLLILAGISIAMLTGNDGLFGRATRAAAQSKLAEAKESVSMTINELVEEYYEERYVNNNTTVAGKTSTEYVKSQLNRIDGNYATGNVTDGKITLVQKAESGNTISATYDGSKLDWKEDPKAE